MTLQQISQRGKQYLKTAETLLGAAKTMTDRAVADQLRALAEDYERRAEKASHVDTAKALAQLNQLLRLKTRPDGGVTAQPPETDS